MTFSGKLLLLPTLLLAFVLCSCTSATAFDATSTPRPAVSTAEPKVAPPRAGAYAALGASETYGVGALPYTRGYAYQVAAGLHAHPFVDAGIPGTTLAAGYDAELTQALLVRPSLVTVFFGVNDLRDGVKRGAFMSDLHDLVATLRRAHARVIIVGLPDIAYLPAVARLGFPGVHHIVVSWNNGMRQVARQTGSTFLNLDQFTRELASHPGYVAPDGLHPSNRGHHRLAQLVLQLIRQDKLWK